MKRLVAYLMCICSLFMSSITVFAQGESSVSITNNEIADKAATLLTSIQGESTYYGMENVDFSKLYLGQEIPVYKFSENADKIEKNIKISCFFVVKRVLLSYKDGYIE